MLRGCQGVVSWLSHLQGASVNFKSYYSNETCLVTTHTFISHLYLSMVGFTLEENHVATDMLMLKFRFYSAFIIDGSGNFISATFLTLASTTYLSLEVN